jgi:hypothetical protein
MPAPVYPVYPIVEEIGWPGKRRGRWVGAYETEWVRKFRVTTHAPLIDPYLATQQTDAATGLTIPSNDPPDQHPSDPNSYVAEYTVQEQSEEPGMYEVEVIYRLEVPDPDQSADNPLQIPAVVTYTGERVELVLQSDLDGYTIANAAGDPFDPPYSVEADMAVVNLAMNLPYFDLSLRADYLWQCNSTQMWGQAQGMVLCTQFDASKSPTLRSGIEYWAARMQFKIFVPPPMDASMTFIDGAGNTVEPQFTWEYCQLLNVGYRCWNPALTSVQACIDTRGQPAAKPLPLDASGRQQILPAQQAGQPPPAYQVIYCQFRVRNTVNFWGLGNLPTNV